MGNPGEHIAIRQYTRNYKKKIRNIYSWRTELEPAYLNNKIDCGDEMEVWGITGTDYKNIKQKRDGDELTTNEIQSFRWLSIIYRLTIGGKYMRN